MKMFHAVVILFAAALVGAGVWFSPLASLGEPTAYYDNTPIAELDGLCCPQGSLCRVDFCGDPDDMTKALKKISAVEIKRAETDGMTIVYAYSPRVCCAAQYLSDGQSYNVMAAYSDGKICIGAPVISGCY